MLPLIKEYDNFFFSVIWLYFVEDKLCFIRFDGKQSDVIEK